MQNMVRLLEKTSALHAAGIQFLNENVTTHKSDAVTTAASDINQVYWFDIPIDQMQNNSDWGVNIWFLLTVSEKKNSIRVYKFFPGKFYTKIMKYEKSIKTEKSGTSPAWRVYLNTNDKKLYADLNCSIYIISVELFNETMNIPLYFYKKP